MNEVINLIDLGLAEEAVSNYQFYVTSEPESAALRRPNLPAVRRATHVYIRRRIVVASVFFSLVAALGLGAGNVLANRGGEPASASAVRPAISYRVQPGDTMWSIAENHRDGANLVNYVDELIALNGGTTVHVGQLISLP
ncbi:MAG: LysM peptidoglycan-binding domain-containing protein [Ilumatobacteraceae bacterium]